MLASKLCRIPITSFVSGIGRPLNKPQLCIKTRVQQMSMESRSGTSRRAARSKLVEKVAAPAGETAFTVGKGMVAGAAALGLGSLCFYGLASKEISALDKRLFWSDEIKQRIRSTYFYFGASVGLTAASAVAIARTPALMNIAMKGSMPALIGGIVAMIGTSMLAQSIPYKEGIGAKQLAWMLHSAVVGGVVAPMTLLGGPLLVRAAWYTAGVVGGLSALAMCAPSEKFLNMGGPLAIGLGVVLVSSLGSMFLPPTTAMGAGLYSISIYGGLVLFSMFLLYDTQKVIQRAEKHPVYSAQKFDPINACLGIYMDTVNIFIRIATILAGGGGRRK
ncbi:growth hormone-inducible transmembrane protein-like [Crassostrea virginica]|uniref:Growth hormone-inducible transmembrane protein-like n=1 Tax=Crassostrea virginica TaxID=6565 RepID=A0A8B8CQG9_CRAVI|nr:growth hormone-inducible transmembrane protein-like [Crassostrea virginica]